MSTGKMSTRTVGNATVVEFAAGTNLDAHAMDSLREPLAQAVENGSGPIVLDFQNVTFASSPAIGTLITLRLKAVRTERRLLLAGLRPHIAEVLHLMQIAQLFEIHGTADDALRAAGAA